MASGYDPKLVRFFMSDDFRQLEKRYAAFKLLLAENTKVLDTMCEIQERVGSRLINLRSFGEEVDKLLMQIQSFINIFNDLSKGEYPWLTDAFALIKQRIHEKLSQGMPSSSSYIYSMDQISSVMTGEVGAKAGNLGELRNILNIPTPKGFVISSNAYLDIIKANRIDKLIQILVSDVGIRGGTDKVAEISEKICRAILEANIPAKIHDSILAALEGFKDVEFFAVRSSAIGEDGTLSFAGQFRSVLKVPSSKVLGAYKKVLASLYSERAIQYRLAQGIPLEHNMPMAVIVLEMIRSQYSGVLYTLDPTNPDSDHMLIAAVRGSGQSAVGGTVSPDIFVLDRKKGGELVAIQKGEDTGRVTGDTSIDGVAQKGSAQENMDQPCLDEGKLHTLFDFATVSERHFGTAQDMEWTIDEKGWIYILQSRPLVLKRQVSCVFPELSKDPIVKGDTVSPGVSAGPVVIIRDKNVRSVPKGAILVIKTMDPEYAKLVPQCAGLIAETGSVATHLASVSREFARPAIANAKGATRVLRDEEMVTIDADQGKVYRGYLESLVRARICEGPRGQDDNKDLPVINGILKHIVPLNLTDIPENMPLNAAVRPRDINTIHDIIRFVHEASIREMFNLGADGESGISHILVDPRIPLTFYIIDIEAGLTPQAVFKRQIDISEIISMPFKALWRGMTHEKISWTGPAQFDLGGFFSVMSRSFVESNVSRSGGKAYVILSKDYLNFHCRLAYHFTVIDAVCTDIPTTNYVTFRFEGGGAGANGRFRRIQLVKEILEALYFRVEIKGDFLTGIFRGGTREETCSRLDQLGRLMGFTRQLDMSLNDEPTRKRYVEAFLSGRYNKEDSERPQ